MDERMDGWTKGWIDDGCLMDRWMDGWVKGWMGEIEKSMLGKWAACLERTYEISEAKK